MNKNFRYFVAYATFKVKRFSGMNKKLILGFTLLTVLPLQAQRILSLDDCRDLARSHNKEIAAARAGVDMAESLRKAARTQYLPNISANGGYIHNQKSISLLGEDKYLPVYAYDAKGAVSYTSSWNNGWTLINGTATPLDKDGVPFNPKTNPEKIVWKNMAYIPKDAFSFDIKDVYVGGITLSQPLFLGGKIRELNRIADSSKKLAEAQQDSKTTETLVNTDIAYWRIVSLVHKQKLAAGYVDLLKKLDQNIDKSVKFGVATKSDALSVKVKLNEAEMSLLQVEDGLNLSRMALCQLCGLPLEEQIVLQDEKQDSLVVTSEVIPVTEQSAENRPEIKSLQQLSQIAASNERLAVSRFMPNAALTAGYSVSNPNMYNGVEDKFGGAYQIGVVVNVPIFHFGERIHTLQAARQAKKMTDIQLDEAREKIQLDIRQSRYKNDEAQRKVRMTSTGKERADENLRYAQVGFEAGTITATTLMEAQTAWLKATSDDIDARIDAQLCKIYLRKALGQMK